MSLVAGACASAPGIRPDPAAATTSTPAPTSTATSVVASAYGGTVVVAVGDGGSPRSLNPFLDGPDTAVLDLIGPAVFARGYDIDPITMELVPNVLASIPSVEDGTVEDLGDGTIAVTVGVAAGARWADGEPITGEDLAFTVRVATDPDLPIRADIARRYSGIETGSLVANARSLSFTMRASTDYEVLFDVIIPRHAVEGSAFAEVSVDDRTTVVIQDAAEFLSASQGLEFLLPLTPGRGVADLYRRIRLGDLRVAPLDQDRPPAPDLRQLARAVAEGSLDPGE